MKIVVKLLKEDNDSTLSNVAINAVNSFFSIEDEFREIKVKGEKKSQDKDKSQEGKNKEFFV